MTGLETLQVRSAGAAKAIVLEIGVAYRERTGVAVAATFDAAGAIRAQFLAGAPCDVLILPAVMQDALGAEARVDPASIAALGRVPTGIAVCAGAGTPAIAEANALRATLVRASALYCPDIVRATAGVHFFGVLRAMGIDARVADRIRAYANGTQAMTALAASGDREAIGCTQVSEILYTPGVVLIGPLPAPYGLSTAYAVAVSAAASNGLAAREFAAHLTGPAARHLRVAGGFGRV